MTSMFQYFEKIRSLLKLPYSLRHQRLLEPIINMFDYESSYGKENKIKGD